MSEIAPRIQTPYLVAEDELDRSLRPRRLEEFVGQESLREQLMVAIEAASCRGEAVDELLLEGALGLVQTSHAQVVAEELDETLKQTAGREVEPTRQIASFRTSA